MCIQHNEYRHQMVTWREWLPFNRSQWSSGEDQWVNFLIGICNSIQPQESYHLSVQQTTIELFQLLYDTLSPVVKSISKYHTGESTPPAENYFVKQQQVNSNEFHSNYSN